MVGPSSAQNELDRDRRQDQAHEAGFRLADVALVKAMR